MRSCKLLTYTLSVALPPAQHARSNASCCPAESTVAALHQTGTCCLN